MSCAWKNHATRIGTIVGRYNHCLIKKQPVEAHLAWWKYAVHGKKFHLYLSEYSISCYFKGKGACRKYFKQKLYNSKGAINEDIQRSQGCQKVKFSYFNSYYRHELMVRSMIICPNVTVTVISPISLLKMRFLLTFCSVIQFLFIFCSAY